MTKGPAEQDEDLPHHLHEFPCDGLIAFFEFIPRVTNAQYLALYSKLSRTAPHAASNIRSWSSDYGKITEKGDGGVCEPLFWRRGMVPEGLWR